MARTTRSILPARNYTWDPKFASRLQRGLVSVPKRALDCQNGEEVWGPRYKKLTKRLRNRKNRRTARNLATSE